MCIPQLPPGLAEYLRAQFTASAGVTAQPVVVGDPGPELAARQAFYRLDAIQRHLTQHVTVPMERLREFRVEARERAAFLLSRKVITEEEHNNLLKPIMELIQVLS